VGPGPDRLRPAVEERLWPLVEGAVGRLDVAGVAVAVVRDGETAARGFGVRDVRSGEPVTARTLFHLASVSKSFVATALVSLALASDGEGPALDLDAPVVRWIPELALADGREGEVTARGLLSHTSGLPDVSDFGWHDPQLGDDALSRFASSLSGWRLQSDPGTEFAYSNAGFELLGLLLSRVTGTTFEDAVRQRLLLPLGLRDSTFRRSEVPAHLACSPHVGLPLQVPEGAYPYTRRHAPSSTLHSNLDDLSRWMTAFLDPGAVLAPAVVDELWQPVVDAGDPPWDESAGLGWFAGVYRGHRTVGHTGADPGFGSRLVLLPERRIGVVVLANSNTVPTSVMASAALDVALGDDGGDEGEGLETLAGVRPSAVRPVAEALAAGGPAAAVAAFERLTAQDPPEHDLDDEEFETAVWGAIELHRTSLVRPLLDVWTTVRPGTSQAWMMRGWADAVDGDDATARRLLRHALELDPDNGDAALVLGNLLPQ
jgi:CubicO group peptidase (beta-lactamase class C family)